MGELVRSARVVLGYPICCNFCLFGYFRRVVGCGVYVSNLSGSGTMSTTTIERDHQAKRGSIATVCIDLLVSSAGDGFFATDDPVELSENEDCLAFSLHVPMDEGFWALRQRWIDEVGVQYVEFKSHPKPACVRCVVSGLCSVYRAFLRRQARLSGKRTMYSIKPPRWILVTIAIILAFLFVLYY